MNRTYGKNAEKDSQDPPTLPLSARGCGDKLCLDNKSKGNQ